jgi:hypothetical protein
MGAKQLAITAAHVREFLALSGQEISCPLNFGNTLANMELDRMDVQHVLKSVELNAYKEGKLHGAEIVTTGTTCEDIAIEVRFRIDPQSGRIIVRSVARI